MTRESADEAAAVIDAETEHHEILRARELLLEALDRLPYADSTPTDLPSADGTDESDFLWQTTLWISALDGTLQGIRDTNTAMQAELLVFRATQKVVRSFFGTGRDTESGGTGPW